LGFPNFPRFAPRRARCYGVSPMATDDRATKRISKFMIVDAYERATAKIPKFKLEQLIGAHVPTPAEANDGEWVTFDEGPLDDSPESLDPSFLVPIDDTEPPPPIDPTERQGMKVINMSWYE
jgi:hypothetical protein